MIDLIQDIMHRGGPVMWPLLGLSVLGLSLCIERAWLYAQASRRKRLTQVRQIATALRQGNHEPAQSFAQTDRSIWGQAIQAFLIAPTSESALLETVDETRHKLERFLPLLSTIITAAPMLGILGTVLGIMDAFGELNTTQTRPDMALVGGAIGEALISTAAGMCVALLVLLPYASLRAQVDRTISRLEHLAAATQEGFRVSDTTSK